MRILDRYLIREIALPFGIALIILTFVLEMPPILERAEELIAKGVAWPTIAHAIILLIPQALAVTIPMAVLLGILIGLGRVSGDREFVAMQACGVSLSRLMRPIGAVALAASAATLYVTVVALPDANQRFREIVWQVVAERVEQNVRPGVFFEDFPGQAIYVRDVRPGGGWRDVLVADTTTPGATHFYLARRGGIRLDREQEIVLLRLEEVVGYSTYADNPEKFERKSHEWLSIRLDPTTVFRDPPARGPAEMTLGDLRKAIDADQRAGNHSAAVDNRIMLQQKLALPATCPILALIALALGASNRKDGRLAGFVVGFAVILVYYVLLYGARGMAKGGSLNPDWAPWVPNIIMGIIAVVLTAWRARAADQPIRISMPVFWRRSTADPAVPPTAAAAPPADRPQVRIVLRIPRLTIPLPRILDLYVAREYLRVALLGITSLLAIFYIATFIDLADELFRGEATTSMMMQYFFFQTPQYVFYVTPMALMVATLVTLGVMTKNSELLVMRACGISLYRTTAPILLFALLGSAFLFVLQERVLASVNREADRLNREIRGLEPPRTIANRHWLLGQNGAVYHYDSYSSAGNHFSKLQVYQIDQAAWTLSSMTQASDASVVGAVTAEDASTAAWIGRDGWVRDFAPLAPDGAAAAETYQPFGERPLSIEAPGYFMMEEPLIQDMPLAVQMTYGQLQHHIAQLRASGTDVARYVVALHRKISFPFVTVIITMLAVPFAVTTGRHGAMYGIGIGVVLAIVYWITFAVFGALGQGVLTPFLAAWAPNILFGAAAAYMILTVRT